MYVFVPRGSKDVMLPYRKLYLICPILSTTKSPLFSSQIKVTVGMYMSLWKLLLSVLTLSTLHVHLHAGKSIPHPYRVAFFQRETKSLTQGWYQGRARRDLAPLSEATALH